MSAGGELSLDQNPAGAEAQSVEDTIQPDDERPIYRGQCEQLLARGFPPSLELAETAYTMLQIMRIRAVMEEDRAASRGITLQTAKSMGDLQATLRSQLVDLQKKAKREGDPEQDLRSAEEWVQEHLGEFQHRCPECGVILLAPALPHWALAPIEIPRVGRQWMVWSQELWDLVVDRTIDLWVMALALRVAPEAIKITAERRGEVWPEWIEMEIQEAALAIRLTAVDRRLALATIKEETP